MTDTTEDAPRIPHYPPPEPKVLGKFNYLTVMKDLYNIIFIPYVGTHACIIARNLNRTEMEELVKALNDELQVTREHIKAGLNDEDIEPNDTV